jgi:hypothetical protein
LLSFRFTGVGRAEATDQSRSRPTDHVMQAQGAAGVRRAVPSRAPMAPSGPDLELHAAASAVVPAASCWWRRRDLSPRPSVCQTGALPLSYVPKGPARAPDDQRVIALRVRRRALRAADGPYDAGATPLCRGLLAVPSQPAVLLPPAFLQRTPTASAMLSGSRNPRRSARTSPIGRTSSRPSAWRLTSRSYRVR